MVQFASRCQLVLLLIAYLYLGTVKIPADVAANFNDLVAHALGYIVLMCSGFFAFPRRDYMVRLFACFFLFSFLIECIQYFLPYRSFSISDIVANALGLLVGTGLGCLLIPVFLRVQDCFSVSSR